MCTTGDPGRIWLSVSAPWLISVTCGEQGLLAEGWKRPYGDSNQQLLPLHRFVLRIVPPLTCEPLPLTPVLLLDMRTLLP